MKQTLSLLRVSLEAVADPKHRDGMTRYFNEEIHPLGVRSAEMNKIVASTWRRIKGWEKSEILELCEALWVAGTFEQGSLACKLSARLDKRLEEADFDRFEVWMDTQVANWAHCDDLGTHAIGTLITTFPSLFTRLAGWTSSDNRWMRRGAFVSLVYPLRKGKFMEDGLRLAKMHLNEPDDLVQKGIGWMLKEGTRLHAMQVFQFVLANKQSMSRIALRTAVEKLPSEMKQLAMGK